MKNKFNWFIILNLILIVAVVVGDVFYIIDDSLLTKSLTSACFVALGAVNLVYAIKNKTTNFKFCILMLVGLFFAMLGDILLEIEFIVGALLFAVGHVFYFVSYCMLISFKWKDLIFGAVIFVPSTLFIVLAPFFDFGGILMELVCVFYAVIISCMVGKSISNYVADKKVLHLLLLIGSCLFFFSDLMLLLNVFGNMPRVIGILCLATYYPAECVLACAIAKCDKEK